jgi:hypothetical protein
VIRPPRRSDRRSESASCPCPGTLFQPIRFKCHSAAVYRLLVCELVSVSDAHSYALHRVVMHVAPRAAQHRSRLCCIRCPEQSTYASSEPSHASECGNGFADARVDWRSIHECGRSSRQHAGASSDARKTRHTGEACGDIGSRGQQHRAARERDAPWKRSSI